MYRALAPFVQGALEIPAQVRNRRRLLLRASLVLTLLAVVFWRPIATWSLFAVWIGLDTLVGELYTDSPASGYGPSAFGGYDHEGVRDLELAVQRTLVRLAPEEPHHRYALAGTLWRCRHFDAAESLYRALLAEDPPFTAAHLPMAMLEWQRGRDAAADAHIEEIRKAAIAVGATPLVTRQSFAGLPRLSQSQLAARTCD